MICPYDGSRLGCGVDSNDDSKYESNGWTKQDERGDDMVVERKTKYLRYEAGSWMDLHLRPAQAAIPRNQHA